MRATTILLFGLLCAGCSSPQFPADGRPVVELWDGGNVFVQPQRTLILAVWKDGKIVSRVDGKGLPNLTVSLLDVPKTKLMTGQLAPDKVRALLNRISETGILQADKYAGSVHPDGPNVALTIRTKGSTNEFTHVAVDDTKYHGDMTTEEQQRFARAWDQTVTAFRSIPALAWRPVAPEDKVTAVVPWRRATK